MIAVSQPGAHAGEKSSLNVPPALPDATDPSSATSAGHDTGR
jgi:hypothetical protein